MKTFLDWLKEVLEFVIAHGLPLFVLLRRIWREVEEGGNQSSAEKRVDFSRRVRSNPKVRRAWKTRNLGHMGEENIAHLRELVHDLCNRVGLAKRPRSPV